MSLSTLRAQSASVIHMRFRWVAIAAMLTSAAIHGSLIGEHLVEKPLLGWLFVASVAGLVCASAAAAMRLPHWQAAATLILGAVILGYMVTRVTGYEQWDGLGIITTAIEGAGLLSVAMAGHHLAGRGPGGEYRSGGRATVPR